MDGAAAARPADARAERLARSSRFTPPAARMTPVLSAAAQARLRAEGRAALWVFFTDKGISDERAFTAALRAAGAGLSERARERRSREQGGRFVPDLDDVPVVARYVDAVRGAGAEIRHTSRWLNAVSVVVTEAEARRIEAMPFVRAILPIRASRRVGPVSQGPPIEGAPTRGSLGDEGDEGYERGPYTPDGDGLEAPMQRDPVLGAATLSKPANPAGYGSSVTQLSGINAIAAHDSGWSGANVLIAMFDTGYRKDHTATVQLKRIAERDFIFNDGETANQVPPDVSSQWDHGTGTWAVAGGYSIGNLIGPAYNSTFALAKTEDVRSETPVEEDNWVAAAEWSDSLGIDVISASLSYFDFDGTANDYTYADLDGQTTVVAQAAILAHRRGIVLSTASSNEGPLPGSIWSPADVDSVLTVGAVDASNAIWVSSSRGPTSDGRIKPEVVAQGVGTIWAVASNNSFGSANGTSLSTPLVGGAAALVREAHPDWTVAQVRTALMNTADKAGTPGNDYGWGRIDVVKAIYSGTVTYPKPFDQLVPINNTNVFATPVTLRWRRSIDRTPGDVVTYNVVLRSLSPSAVVYTTTTAETTTVCTAYLGPNKVYEWLVTAVDLLGHERPSREKFRFTTGATTDVAIPPAASRILLHQNRPNPAHRATEIPFTLAGGGEVIPVTLRVFDPRGRLVRTLIDRPEVTGRHYLVDWDGADQMGRRAASGIYYYQLRAGSVVLTRRMVLLR